MSKRHAFTLIEVLISIVLLGLIIPALYSSVNLLRDSNAHLFSYVKKAQKITKSTEVLFLDIASSDGNISLKTEEFSRVCMEETKNSLYALGAPKVCWLVLKKENTLVRVEGVAYHLPLLSEENVEVDTIMSNIEIFNISRSQDKGQSMLLVLLKQKGKEAISFMVQGIDKPKKREKKVKKQKPKKALLG